MFTDHIELTSCPLTIQQISDCIISSFVFRLLRSFLLHQHDQTSLWWFVCICCFMNDCLHMILINFFIMSSCVNVFNSTFCLMKISFMILIISKSVNFNFSTNFFSNSCNCSWNALLHSIHHLISIDFCTNMTFSIYWKFIELHHWLFTYLRMLYLMFFFFKNFVIHRCFRFNNTCYLCWL